MVQQFFENVETKAVGSLTVSGANTVALEVGRPVYVKRVVLVTKTALTGADATLTLGKRKADGTGAAQHSQFTLPYANSAVNDVSFYNVGEPSATPTTGVDGSTVYSSAPDLLRVDPGEEVYVTADGSPTAGVVEVYVETIPLGFDEASGTKLARV